MVYCAQSLTQEQRVSVVESGKLLNSQGIRAIRQRIEDLQIHSNLDSCNLKVLKIQRSVAKSHFPGLRCSVVPDVKG